MEKEDVDDIINVVQRWESLGLLTGLPPIEKTELAQILDNATRLLLMDFTLNKIPKKVSDVMDEIYIPICRRLYRRVGPFFDLDNMLSELLGSVDEKWDEIFSSEVDKSKKDPVVQFCIDFADSYVDDEISKNVLNDEEYHEKVEVLLSKMREILLNKHIVMYTEREGDDFVLKTNNEIKPYLRTRFTNQESAKLFLLGFLSDINKKF